MRDCLGIFVEVNLHYQATLRSMSLLEHEIKSQFSGQLDESIIAGFSNN